MINWMDVQNRWTEQDGENWMDWIEKTELDELNGMD